MQSLGAMRRKNAGVYSVVIVREGGRSSIPEAAVIEPRSRGVLDTPPSRGTTARYKATIARNNSRLKQEQLATTRSCK